MFMSTSNKNCLYCGNPLTGIKRKYCSELCGVKDWRLKNHDAYRLIEKKHKHKTGDRYYKKYYKINREKINEKRILRCYNITPECYKKMMESQNDCCAICKKHQSTFKRRLCIDHNHETNKIRGILCDNCNTMIGLSKDSIQTFQSAIKYIQKYNTN